MTSDGALLPCPPPPAAAVPSFDALPGDVLQLIGAHLPLPSLVAAARCSTRLHAALLLPLLTDKLRSEAELLLPRLTRCPPAPLATELLDVSSLHLSTFHAAVLAHLLCTYKPHPINCRTPPPLLPHCRVEVVRIAEAHLPVGRMMRGAALDPLKYDSHRLQLQDVAFLCGMFAHGAGRRFRLASSCITDGAVATLARSLEAGTPHLRHLTLADNLITSAGSDALARHYPRGLRRLRELSLGCNAIQSLDGLADAFACGGAALEWLELQHNQIDDDGAKALSRALSGGHLSQLAVLVLEDNVIDAAGVRALVDVATRHFTRLQLLDLEHNRRSDETVVYSHPNSISAAL
ncbi:hypothetical protein AB1Y20_021856 [Prymnesium parvum]|uniref:Uncharacterized protein n=1 Tax=Prymnesium parvum TaxID=97485 RepID=A0AB34JNP0_PRYPA